MKEKTRARSESHRLVLRFTLIGMISHVSQVMGYSNYVKKIDFRKKWLKSSEPEAGHFLDM
jgi:hypothetical protein